MNNQNKESTVDFINRFWKIEQQPNRFNRWGERKYITASDEKYHQVQKELSRLPDIDPRAYDLYKAARLTDSQGLEFVFSSNSQFPVPVKFQSSGIYLIPCFKPFDFQNLEADDRRDKMSGIGRFIYDGWAAFPDKKFTLEQVDNFVHYFDNQIAMFGIVGDYKAYWEPKYQFSKPPIPSQYMSVGEIGSTDYSIDLLSQLPDNDRRALSRSAAWFSNALKTDAIQKFLLLFVCIESLAQYINGKTRNGSVLQNHFKSPRPESETGLTKRQRKSARKEQRERCIKEQLTTNQDLSNAIRTAYYRCIQPSISIMLKEHLSLVFGDDEVGTLLFEKQSGNKTLWQLRNDIAHGTIHVLNRSETIFVRQQAFLLERVARNYLRAIFSNLAKNNYFTSVKPPILSIPASQGIGSEGTDYNGSTDMVEYYLNLSSLSSTSVTMKFADQNQQSLRVGFSLE